MPGAICKFGSAYTLGKKTDNAVNVTITSAEYVVTRVRADVTHIYPPVDQKFLVVHFTAHNPLPRDVPIERLIKFTAVPPIGDNREAVDSWFEAPPNVRATVHLKPAQKVSLYTVIPVPAAGPIDKLILENTSSSGSLVARYPLAGMVKKIAPPYADPADPNGFTPLKKMSVKMGEIVQVEDFDVTVTKVEQVEATGDPLETPNVDMCYVLVTLQLSYRGEVDGSVTGLGGGWLENELFDADGGTWTQYNNGVLRPSAVDFFTPKCDFGQTVSIRRVYVVKRGIKLGYLKLGTYNSREVRWDLGGFTTK